MSIWTAVKDEYSDTYHIPDVVFADREGNAYMYEEDAFLIQAAPDLLAALECLLREVEAHDNKTPGELQAIRAAATAIKLAREGR